MKYTYNKLVRDRIPECIDKQEGRKAKYRILNDDEYIESLNKKLIEESHEFGYPILKIPNNVMKEIYY